MINNKIYRSGTLHPGEGRTIEGYAAVFEEVSIPIWDNQGSGYKEIIHRGAITEDLIKKSDIIANMNHDDNYMMARLRNGIGNIELTIDDHGLKFSFQAPETVKGEELLQHIKRGEITNCSFGYCMDYRDKGAEKWTKQADGTELREVFRIAYIFDISCVITAAFQGTECTTRDIDKLMTEIQSLGSSPRNELDDSLTGFYEDLLDELDK